jgi:AcrR family transcriptional regulator
VPETVRDFRRGQIVAAARRVVAEQGLDALTFGALEDRLSFTRGVITYHFASKDEIVRAVFASAIEEIDAAVKSEVQASAAIEDKVRSVLRANVRGFVDRAEAGRVLLSSRYRARSAKLLREAIAAGAIARIDPKAMATLLVGIVLGIATQHYFDPGSIDVDAAVAEAAETVLARLAPRRTSRH